jgi:hypothetical protein
MPGQCTCTGQVRRAICCIKSGDNNICCHRLLADSTATPQADLRLSIGQGVPSQCVAAQCKITQSVSQSVGQLVINQRQGQQGGHHDKHQG